MGDTQWVSDMKGTVLPSGGTTDATTGDDGLDPNTVAVSIIRAINVQMLSRGVKFVVQVGDLVDKSTLGGVASSLPEYTRATWSQELYNAGVGFFPLRGNHDDGAAVAADFLRAYPQTRGGLMGATPMDAYLASFEGGAFPAFSAPSITAWPFPLGDNFASPNSAMEGLSYSFDYRNVRIVMVDIFTNAGGAAPIAGQQPWITATLQDRPVGSHAFVFAHKGIITENHIDNLFSSDKTQAPSYDAASQNAFIDSMVSTGARYLHVGHDHMHDRSLISTTDGSATDYVQQIVSASNSNKFYTPYVPSNDEVFNYGTAPAATHDGRTVKAGTPTGILRQRSLAQELRTVGYYIYTVDGPRVTVDYYSTTPLNLVNPVDGGDYANAEFNFATYATAGAFTKTDSFGYSLNGREFVVSPGGSYTSIVDSFGGTTFQILGGFNGSTSVDYGGRAMHKAIDTGWTPRVCYGNAASKLLSNALTLWGLTNLGWNSVGGTNQAGTTDPMVISLSYDAALAGAAANGTFGVVALAGGTWAKAGTGTGIVGPYFGGASLPPVGTWGVATRRLTPLGRW